MEGSGHGMEGMRKAMTNTSGQPIIIQRVSQLLAAVLSSLSHLVLRINTEVHKMEPIQKLPGAI